MERQQVKPVGATVHRDVDVRVIAATNRHLALEVEAGRFRQDLYYRLSVIRIDLPPLRERLEDVLLLAHHFAQSYQKDAQTIMTDDVERLLMAYHWPGNARELRNVIERLAVLPEMGAEALAAAAQAGGSTGSATLGKLASLPFHEARRRWQDVFEEQYLLAKLTRANGVVTAAAESAALPRATFHRLLKRHGLKAK